MAREVSPPVISGLIGNVCAYTITGRATSRRGRFGGKGFFHPFPCASSDVFEDLEVFDEDTDWA